MEIVESLDYVVANIHLEVVAMAMVLGIVLDIESDFDP